MLAGNIEGDAHGMRKIYMSKHNESSSDEIKAAEKRWNTAKKGNGKPLPQYWQGHIRIVGLKQRDGDGIVALLPMKLVPPGSSPPPESKAEVIESKLLKRIVRKRPAGLFSDGAKAWLAALKEPGMKQVRKLAVAHRKRQWTKKFPMAKKSKSLSRTGGTQCIDRWWEGVDSFIPKQSVGPWNRVLGLGIESWAIEASGVCNEPHDCPQTLLKSVFSICAFSRHL